MIQLKDLTLGYEQRTLLEKVSAHITGGQLVALLGRNGTGKSTLLRAVMGLEKPQNGEIILHGNNIASLKPEELARNISFVTTDKVRIANLRCRDVVALGRAPYTNWLGQLQGEDKEKVDNAMRLVGMDSYAEKTMDKMSDGECQRIMIAQLKSSVSMMSLPIRKRRKVYPVFHTRPGHRSLSLRHDHAD